MATKDKSATPTTTIKKMSQGYGYKYSDLSTIHEELEKQGITYYQYTEYDEKAGADYMWTVLCVNGEEQKPRRGCQIIMGEGMKSAAQAQGSGITYARRYSLLMALGWATEDDDGDSAGQLPPRQPQRPNKVDFKAVREKLGEIETVEELNAYWNSLHLSDKQAEILKSDFSARKVKIGVGVGA